MVKFGQHLQFYLESEEGLGSSHYYVPYIEIRDSRIPILSPTLLDNSQYPIGTLRTKFIADWRNALDKASDDFRISTAAAWSNVYRAISMIPQARGAPLETALRLYTPTVGITASQDMLNFLKGILSAATLNSEALRKLVKKFDKNITSVHALVRVSNHSHKENGNGFDVPDYKTPLCEILLPELYSSAFTIGIATVQDCIDTLRELLDDDYDDDHATSDGT